VTRFTVLLEVVWRGAVVGSTCDDVEAETADEAEELAVERWKAARPGYSFAPLLTLTAPA
jgi:phosphoribosylaminoimidazole-succinocarboxamide synthase